MSTTEQTPAGLQFVLPGAERDSPAKAATRAATEPMRPTVPQRPCDVGLFSDDARQLDLVEVLARADAKGTR